MKKKKQSWLKRRVVKIRVLPWFWKLVATVIIFFGAGTVGFQLVTAPDDFIMILGFVLLVAALWLLIQMWLPAEEQE